MLLAHPQQARKVLGDELTHIEPRDDPAATAFRQFAANLRTALDQLARTTTPLDPSR